MPTDMFVSIRLSQVQTVVYMIMLRCTHADLVQFIKTTPVRQDKRKAAAMPAPPRAAVALTNSNITADAATTVSVVTSDADLGGADDAVDEHVSMLQATGHRDAERTWTVDRLLLHGPP
jgi:hypothetical protein